MKKILLILLTATLIMLTGCIEMGEGGLEETAKGVITQFMPSLCDEFYKEEGLEKQKDECFAKTAVKNKNLELCDEVESNAIREYQCITEIAKAKKDPSICQQISDEDIKDSCLRDVGKETGDAATCDGISDTATRDECLLVLAYEKQDPSVCGKIQTTRHKDACLRYAAYVQKKPELCNQITDAGMKAQCQGYFS